MSTKAEIAQRLAASRNLSRKQSLDAVDEFLQAVRTAILRGEKVSLVGFGTFDLRYKRPRQGRNPRTSERIDIPPKAMAVFKPGKAFREMVGGAEHPDAPEIEDEE